MFNHNEALNSAILEGATKVYNQYGGFCISDSLDIMWYKDEDWLHTFEEILEGVKNGETETIWTLKNEFKIELENHYFIIKNSDTVYSEDSVSPAIAKIPDYLEKELFLYLTTLLRGYYEY